VCSTTLFSPFLSSINTCVLKTIKETMRIVVATLISMAASASAFGMSSSISLTSCVDESSFSKKKNQRLVMHDNINYTR
jgi:hypothetical protein